MLHFKLGAICFAIFTSSLSAMVYLQGKQAKHFSFRLFTSLANPSGNTFRTEVADKIRLPWSLNYHSTMFFIGSCFSENISDRLRQYKFNVLSNPQGILFNPISIEKCITDIISQNSLDETKGIFHDKNTGLFHAWDVHSDYSSQSIEEIKRSVHASRNNAKNFLEKSSVAFITLGTAKVHSLVTSTSRYPDRIVANCHKQPGTMFTNRILSYQEITQSLNRTLLFLRACNPNIQVVFTISPVRHTRDTMIVNSYSKSLLLTSVHQMVQEHADYVSYFPSYEYVMDELRDYRWYEEDMIHPSPAAVDFIFQHFQQKFISEASVLSLMKQIETFRRNIEHRPRFPQSPVYKQHLGKCMQQLQELESEFDQLSLTYQRQQLQEDRDQLEKIVTQI